MAQARRRPSPDLDSYAPLLLEDLLSGQHDWRPVPDIVRLSFKALVDLLATQGAAIGEIERQLPAKATKAEVMAGLSTKANVSDMTQALLEANCAWQKSATTEVLDLALKEKVSRSELASLTRPGVSEKEVRGLIEQKVSIGHLEAELQPLQEAMAETELRFDASIQRLEAEIQELCQLLDQKADLVEVEKLTQSKANRQSVISALHTKAGREEVETALGRKAEGEKPVGRLGCGLHGGQSHAGFHRQGIVCRIKATQPVHPPQRQHNVGAAVIRGGATAQASVAALGDNGHARLGTQAHQGGHLCRGGRAGDQPGGGLTQFPPPAGSELQSEGAGARGQAGRATDVTAVTEARDPGVDCGALGDGPAPSRWARPGAR